MKQNNKVSTIEPITVYKYEMFFSYTTKVGHSKVKAKTIEHVNEERAIDAFKKWKERQKSISNIELLGITDNKIPRIIETYKDVIKFKKK